MGVIVRTLLAAAIGCTVTGIVHGAEEVRLRGKVVSENQAPIRAALVTLVNGIDRTELTAGPSGEFLFQVETPGDYFLEARHEGYYRLRAQAVHLNPGDNDVILLLNRQQELVESLTVEASPPGIDHARTSAERVLTGKQIIEIPYPSSHSLRHALKVMPAVVHDAHSGLHIDGGAENQIQYSLDGFNVSDPLTGRFEARVSVEAVQAVELATGSLVAEYGKGSAGTMAIRTRSGDDRFRYTATNFFPGFSYEKGFLFKDWTPRFGISGPIRKGRAWFSNQVDTQYVQSVVEELPKGQDRASSWRLSNMLQAQVNVTSSNILTGGFLVNLWNAARTGLSAIDPMETTVDRRSRQWFAYLRDQIYFHRGMVVELGYARNRTFGREIPQGHGFLRLTPEGRRGNYFVDATRTGARDQLTANLFLPAITGFGQHRTKAGVDLNRVSFWQQARRSGYEHFRPDGTRLSRVVFAGPSSFELLTWEASSYIQDAWRPVAGVTIDMGLRQDWDRLVNKVNLAPRLGASWSPGENRTKLYAGYSILYDATHLRAFGRPLDQHAIWTNYSPEQQITAGPALNLYFIPARTYGSPKYTNYSAGLEQVLPKGVFLRVNGLRKRGEGGFTYRNVLSGIEVVPLEDAEPLGARRISGLFELKNDRVDVYDSVEITLRQSFRRRYEWMASYRRSRALSNGVMDLGIDEPTIITNNVGRLPWDTPNRFLGWGYFPLPKPGWAFAYLIEYRNGFPFSVQDGEGRQVGDFNSYRFPMFFDLNFHVERTFRLRGRQWAVRAGFLNITDHKNPNTVNSNMASPNFMHYYGGQRRSLNFRVRLIGAGG